MFCYVLLCIKLIFVFHQIWMKLGEVVVWYKCVLQLLQLHKVSLNLTQLTQSNLNNNSILLYTQNDCTTTLGLSVCPTATTK